MPDIVLIDDEPTIVGVLSRVVHTRAGMRVLGFTESAAALQWLGDHTPALIITDHLMPGPTGLDVARAVRGAASTRAVPILMLTGSNEPELGAMARAAGVDRIATKPLRLGELLQLIDEMLPQSALPQRL